MHYNQFHDGLPQLLGYKLNQDGGEILMTYAGVSINKIGGDLQRRDKMLFVFEMMR